MHRATLFRKLEAAGFVPRRVWLTPKQAAKADKWDAENRASLEKTPATNDRDGEK
jgi:hypothetical protein